MEQHDYAAELPQEPPEGLIPWLQKKGKLQEHVIWYKAAWVHDPLTGQRKRMAQLRCSACGDTMYADRIPNPGHTFGYVDPESGHPVSSGNHVRCPMCGCAAEALHVGRGRGGRSGKEYWPLTITRVGDRLALVGWCVGKYISCEGEESVSCRQYEAYVVEERKVVRLMGYIKCLSTVSFFGHWEQRRNCLDNWGEADLVYPWDRRLLIGSTAENSKLDLYMRAAKEPYPVTYLRLWQRHRNIENLIMQGCGALVGEMIRAESYRYSYERARGVPQLAEINWKEKRPAKMLGLSGEEFRFCRALKWTPEELQFYRLCRERGIRLRVPEDLDDCKAAGLHWCRWVIEQERAPLLRTVRYLKRQRTKDRRADGHILDDYWRIAKSEGYDNTDVTTTHDFAPDYANMDLGILTVTSAAGSASGKTKLTVSGNEGDLMVKVGAQPAAVKPGMKPTSKWTAYTSGTDLDAATGSYATVVEVDDFGKVVAAGSVTVTANGG